MKKNIISFISGALCMAVLSGGIAVFASGAWKNISVLENDITVVVDGKQISESNFVYNDRTYLPLRAVAEAVGKEVTYDETTNTAYIGEVPAKPVDTYSYYEGLSVNVPDYTSVTGVPTTNGELDVSLNSRSVPHASKYFYNNPNKDNNSKYIQALTDEGFTYVGILDDASVAYRKGTWAVVIGMATEEGHVGELEINIFDMSKFS